MGKYKNGDIVLVRDDLYSGMDIAFGFNREMSRFCGKFVEIKSSHNDNCYDTTRYHIKGDTENWSWCEEMFKECKAIFTDKIICPKCHKPNDYDIKEQSRILIGKIILCKSCKGRA